MKGLEDAFAMRGAANSSSRILGCRGISRVFAALLEYMPARLETLLESTSSVMGREGLIRCLSELERCGLVERRYRLKGVAGRLLGEAAYGVVRKTNNIAAADLAFKAKANQIIELLSDINREWAVTLGEEGSEEAARKRILRWLKDKTEAERTA